MAATAEKETPPCCVARIEAPGAGGGVARRAAAGEVAVHDWTEERGDGGRAVASSLIRPVDALPETAPAKPPPNKG